MPRSKKQIVICADDFGQNEAINRGILQLARMGRISATSCLTQAPAWSQGAAALRSCDIDVGLHLNFTEDFATGSDFHRPLPVLIRDAWLRRLNSVTLQRAIECQCDLFEQYMKREPDYFDGHQHVHQFPQIRDALMEVLLRRYDCDDFWVRYTGMSDPAFFRGLALKARVIALLGSAALRRRLARADIPFNSDFAGVYELSGGSARYATAMRTWLTQIAAGGVIMCHPAAAVERPDTIGEQRVAEFSFLSGDDFGEMLQACGCRVARFQT